MNLKCISLAAVIFLAAVASACGGDGSQDLSGAAVGVEEPVEPAPGGEEPAPGGEQPAPGAEEPVKPVDPNAPSEPGKGSEEEPAPVAGPVSLLDAANSIAPTKRVNHQVLEEACADNADCLQELEAYKAAIAEMCTGAEATVACPQGIAEFNTDIPSSQLRAGRVPVGYPTSEDVAASIEAGAEGAEEPVSGDEPVAGEEPVATEPEVEKVVKALETWAEAHERTAADLVDGTCADADCKAGLAALVAFIESDCGGAACPAGIEGFLDKPTAEEIASGELGETFPLTSDVLELAKSLEAAPAAP